MFCPECGTNNDDNAAFCCNCGTPLQTAAKPQISPDITVPEKKEGLSTGDKLLLIELAAALLSIIIFVVVYNTQFSAKSIAEKYAEAAFKRDWNSVYDTLYIDNSSEFLTKKAFITAQSMNASQEKQRVRIKKIKKLTGGFTSQAYRVSYRVEDYSDTMTIELKRKGLSWKVDTDEYLSKNYMVTVPSGADVTVDKIDITKDIKPSTKKDGYDTYEIPVVFGSTHYIELSGDELEPHAQCLTFYYDKEDDTGNVTRSIINAPYNEKTLNKVMKQASKDLEAILKSASENKRMSEVDIFDNVEDGRLGIISEAYERLRNDTFGNADSSYTLTKYQITNGELNGYMTSYEHVVQVDIKGNYKFENESLSYDRSRTTTDNGDGTCTHSLQYMNIDGEWILFDMDLDMSGVY